ncbi:MAG: tRNA pseudouridine(38-40) synthase TruA [Actinomycetota bacterium]|nr:tRNA pseudouridine(38-40) synthase TruA [Actinomycetota bacterium]
MRLDLGYDGTDFAGWARQPGQRTVQGTVEEALGTILRVPARLTVAGRTDAGVHATGQVAHVDLPAAVSARFEPSLLRRLAGVLPRDVRVRAVAAAPEGFDARFSALQRRYAYRVADTDWGVEPVHRRTTVHWPRPLDEQLMAAAAQALLGEHDFAAFCRRREGATTVRTLRRLDWHRDADRVLTATVEADAFCHSMVRSLVGALLDVGTRARGIEWPAEVLAAGVREARVHVAPAHGLTLVAVSYPEAGALAERARQTRRRREPRAIGP